VKRYRILRKLLEDGQGEKSYGLEVPERSDRSRKRVKRWPGLNTETARRPFNRKRRGSKELQGMTRFLHAIIIIIIIERKIFACQLGTDR
jgi:hypothetical protein